MGSLVATVRLKQVPAVDGVREEDVVVDVDVGTGLFHRIDRRDGLVHHRSGALLRCIDIVEEDLPYHADS